MAVGARKESPMSCLAEGAEVATSRVEGLHPGHDALLGEVLGVLKH